MDETRDPKGETRDPRPGTHLIGGTRDPKLMTLKMRPKTQDPRPKTLKERLGTHMIDETVDPKLTSLVNLGHKNYDLHKLNQMSYKSF